MLIAIIIISICTAMFSFFSSMAEGALYSITPGKVEELRAKGTANGLRIYKMKQNIDEPIAAILTMNTISNSLGPALAGSLIGRAFAESPDLATLIYGCLMTCFLLMFSEILPKTLGVTYADRIAPLLTIPILIIIFLMKPLLFLTRTVTSFFKPSNIDEVTAPSENEILAMAKISEKAGKISSDEALWLTNALLLNDVTAKDLMTPRTVVYMLPTDLPLSMISANSDHWSHSRLPLVHNNNPDKVEGIIYRRTVFDHLVRDDKETLAKTRLRDLMRPAVFVPETIPANELLRKFIESQEYLIVVTNEFGGMEGVISLEDVLEFMIGVEIVDPYDKYPDMQAHARMMAQRKAKRHQLAELVDDRIAASPITTAAETMSHRLP
ncbi:MAG: CNNM domain-containing protein [Candidatus Sumerlaeia bacterium]|nr:CNNM domain-containing protein [Candidatus Sumerlaeia bacterium]